MRTLDSVNPQQQQQQQQQPRFFSPPSLPKTGWTLDDVSSPSIVNLQPETPGARSPTQHQASPIEQHVDDDTGLPFYFDPNTGLSAWDMADLTGGAEEELKVDDKSEDAGSNKMSSLIAVTDLSNLATAYGSGADAARRKSRPKRIQHRNCCSRCRPKKKKQRRFYFESSDDEDEASEYKDDETEPRPRTIWQYCMCKRRRPNEKPQLHARGAANCAFKCCCPPCAVYHGASIEVSLC